MRQHYLISVVTQNAPTKQRKRYQLRILAGRANPIEFFWTQFRELKHSANSFSSCNPFLSLPSIAVDNSKIIDTYSSHIVLSSHYLGL